MGSKKEVILIDSDDEEKQNIDPSYAVFVDMIEKNQEKVRVQKALSVKTPFFEGSSKNKMVLAEGSSKWLVNRGPQYGGGRFFFDKHCVFGNNMKLDKSKCDHLDRFTKDFPGKPIKYYVYMTTPSTVVKNKAKMEFGLDFTNKYLKQYLENPVDVCVMCTNRNKHRAVKMKIGEATGKAMLSGGWSQAAEYFRLKEGEIYLFSFEPCKRHVLEIMLVKIE